MKAVFVELPETHMIFHVLDEEICGGMAKKFENLGLTRVDINYPLNSCDDFQNLGNGLYRQGNFFCGGFGITHAMQGATFSTKFDPDNKTVRVKLKGRFFCCHLLEDRQVYGENRQNIGFVSSIRLRDKKGKLLKKPRDQWGVSSPIEAFVEKGTYHNAAWRVAFKVLVEKRFI